MDQTGSKKETTGSDPNNIVDFVENDLGIELLEYQKELLTKTYEAYKKDEKLHLHSMPRRTSLVPMAIRLIFARYEEGKNDRTFERETLSTGAAGCADDQ